MKRVIAIAAIQDGTLLLVKKQQTWLLPGGKPNDGETNEACLIRELSEELPGCIATKLELFGSWSGITPHTGDVRTLVVYTGEIMGSIDPSAEISAAEWIPTANLVEYQLAEATRKAITHLISAGRL